VHNIGNYIVRGKIWEAFESDEQPVLLIDEIDKRVHNIGNYIVRGKIWEAFESDEQPVLLIDEIDKADIEFPNDLLRELDRMEFYVYETKKLVEARHRPIIVITSNNEKELPDAFLNNRHHE
jgi:MoxR-like ATPase